jgi:peptide/nickel transport system permease protein
MVRYTGRRLVSGLLTLFLFVTLLFFVINMVTPGDWVSQFILTAEGAEALREELSLNRPLWQQYLSWLVGLVTLNLGTSFGRGDVWDAIVAALPSPLLVLAIGLTLAFVLGGWLGRVSAYKGKSLASGSMTFVAIVFLTAFPPVLAILMEQGIRSTFGFVFLGRLGSLDRELWEGLEVSIGEQLSPGEVMWRMLAVLVVTLVLLRVLERMVRRFTRRRVSPWLFLLAMVVIPLLVWGQMGLTGRVFDIALASILLLTGVVLLTFGEVLLITRAAMDDVMLEDYVMVARAKGLPEREVRDKHAARTALLPVLSRFTVSIPYFLTGLVILEAVFGGSGSQGLGTLVFDAMHSQDTPLIVGSLLVIGVLTLFLRIALDVLHAALDPRIRFDRSTDGY